jgi:hypothetical protein
LELLLLLSALLSGMTGVMAGQRAADVPQMERSAAEAVVHTVVQGAADAAAVQGQRPRQALPSLASVAEQAPRSHVSVPPMSGLSPRGEKRLE